MSWVEIVTVILGLIYLILAIRENIWCWIFGIVSSMGSIYLFFTGKLYAESILYFYYVLAGIYGWYSWSQKNEKQENLEIQIWPLSRHLFGILACILLSLALAQVLATYTDAQQPYVDAHTTMFSFFATYLVTRKELYNWWYWIVIDAVSVWLYADRGYFLYAALMFFYTFLAISGLMNWMKSYNQNKISLSE